MIFKQFLSLKVVLWEGCLSSKSLWVKVCFYLDADLLLLYAYVASTRWKLNFKSKTAMTKLIYNAVPCFL